MHETGLGNSPEASTKKKKKKKKKENGGGEKDRLVLGAVHEGW